MRVTIDATKLSHELALNAVCKHSFMTLYSLNPAQVRRVIDNDKDEEIKSTVAENSYTRKTKESGKMWDHLRKLYREKYDYYFETITNLSDEIS